MLQGGSDLHGIIQPARPQPPMASPVAGTGEAWSATLLLQPWPGGICQSQAWACRCLGLLGGFTLGCSAMGCPHPPGWGKAAGPLPA